MRYSFWKQNGEYKWLLLIKLDSTTIKTQLLNQQHDHGPWQVPDLCRQRTISKKCREPSKNSTSAIKVQILTFSNVLIAAHNAWLTRPCSKDDLAEKKSTQEKMQKCSTGCTQDPPPPSSSSFTCRGHNVNSFITGISVTKWKFSREGWSDSTRPQLLRLHNSIQRISCYPADKTYQLAIHLSTG